VDQRIADVDRIYRTLDADETLALLNKYGVEYIYVGQLEKLYYPVAGIEKFGTGLGGSLIRVYENEEVSIYRVTDTAF